MLRFFRPVVKMSVDYSLEAFQQRAMVAEEKLKLLRRHLLELKKSSVNGKKEELLMKNKELKEKVELLKSQLKAAEIANGVIQVALPSESETVTTKPTEPLAEKQPVKSQKKTASAKTNKGKASSESKPKAQKPPGNTVVDVTRLDMRVGQIVKVDIHHDADTLYVEQVHVGEEANRTVVTSARHQIPIEQMRDRMVVVMCNLKPVNMRGIVSQGMLMCAVRDDELEILDPPPGSVPGDRITFQGYSGEPDAILNPKKKIWEKVKPDLHVNEEGVACYKGVPFTVRGKGLCKTQSMKSCDVR